MAWVHLLGRKFADALIDPEFDLLLDWPYWNRLGRQGHCYYASCRGRRFCISQSCRRGPDLVNNLERVFRNGDSVDERAGPFYTYRKGQVGLLVAAWNGSQWLQMISPGTPDQPRDDFAELAKKIQADPIVDARRQLQAAIRNLSRRKTRGAVGRSAHTQLQELEEEIFEHLRGQRDFDW